MESAFGIDHGEVSKAFGMGMASLGAAAAKKTLQAGTGLRRVGAGAMAGGRVAGRPLQQKAGLAGIRAGGGLRKLGGAMAARPGLTGGLAAGGAAAGAGAAGGALTNRRRF